MHGAGVRKICRVGNETKMLAKGKTYGGVSVDEKTRVAILAALNLNEERLLLNLSEGRHIKTVRIEVKLNKIVPIHANGPS